MAKMIRYTVAAYMDVEPLNGESNMEDVVDRLREHGAAVVTDVEIISEEVSNATPWNGILALTREEAAELLDFIPYGGKRDRVRARLRGILDGG